MIVALLLMLSLNFAYASEELVRVCFANSQEAQTGRAHINFLVLETDRIKISSHCIDIFSTSKRNQLFVNYIKRKYPHVAISSNLANLKQCKFKLTEFSKETKSKTNLNMNNKVLNLAKQNKQANKTKVGVLNILEGTPSSIQYDEFKIDITCRIRGTSYIVELSSDSAKLNFSSSRILKKGQKVELGSLIESSLNKSDTKAINGVNLSKGRIQSNTQLFLEAM